jgi:hypothetical protein
MARRELMVTHYEAEMVLLPVKDARQEVLRLTVFGSNFPERAIEPEMFAVEVQAHNVSIARDQKSIRGFFSQLPPEGAPIRVRYGDSQEGVLREPFFARRVRPLDKECRSDAEKR